MNIYEGLLITIFIIGTINMVEHYIFTLSPKLSDVLSVINALPCYEVRVYKNRKRLKRTEWINYLTHTVYYAKFYDGVLYITIN